MSAARSSRRPRARELGVAPGVLPTGPHNAITDVEGVRVGHATLIEGEDVRTGVTAILPRSGNVFEERVVGGGFVLNGAGEIAGLTQILEWGLIETPILLTNTLAVGICGEAAVRHMLDSYPEIGNEADVIIPVVGECDDSWLNDIRGRHIRPEHVYTAIDTADDGDVEEGSVGGGTGMMTCGFKSGIGSASRQVPATHGVYTLGVLVMSNFGLIDDLIVEGVPIGRVLAPEYGGMPTRTHTKGSIICVAATDAPLQTHQLNRIAKRVALGIGRTGSYAAHTSGEIVIAFSTANRVPRSTESMIYELTLLLDSHMDPLYQAAVEATEEAILNALFACETFTGTAGRVAPGLPAERVADLVARSRVVAGPTG